MKIKAAALVLAFASGCLPDPRGAWFAPDAGLYIYDYDGGAPYWAVNGLYLEKSYTSAGIWCSQLKIVDGKFMSLTPPSEGVRVINGSSNNYKFTAELEDGFIDEGYRLANPNADVSGIVRLAFDAGLYFETDDRAELRWLAEYYDDTGVINSEGGTQWFERGPLECR